jgi:hypothetical protein
MPGITGDNATMKMLRSLGFLLLLAIGCGQDAPAPQPAPAPAADTARVLEDLGRAMTEQYKSTPWQVSVFGDTGTSSLAFDCSDDPHPEDVCFMLYKRYPGEDERRVLKMMGVKRLFFRAGFTKKSWEKLVK